MTSPSKSPHDVDVVVIGGGSAGFCAAVAAARQGSQVILLEKSNRLGGMGPLAFVHTFCGLYMPDTSQPPRIANPGLPEEIERSIRRLTGQSVPTTMGRVYVLPQHPEIYDRVAKDLVAAEKDHLLTMMESECVGITQRGDGGFTLDVQSERGRERIHCRSIVDCSADAIIAPFLSATRQSCGADHLQKPAFIFGLKNIGSEVREESFRMRLALDLVHAVRAETLPSCVLGVTIRSSVHEGECFVSMDLDSQAVSWNPSCDEACAEIENIGKSLASKLCEFLKSKYPFFENASDPHFPPSIGVRESYRWLGKHTLTEDELIEGIHFTDTVAYATWPIEMREDARGAKFKYFTSNEASEIPLRSLVSAEVPGVYFAGRCLSATHEALGSVRVMGTCFATGQAAGMAASLHASGIVMLDEQALSIQQGLWGRKLG